MTQRHTWETSVFHPIVEGVHAGAVCLGSSFDVADQRSDGTDHIHIDGEPAESYENGVECLRCAYGDGVSVAGHADECPVHCADVLLWY